MTMQELSSVLCLLMTACATGPAPIDASGADGAAVIDDADTPERRDGGIPDLPDVGPPTCSDPVPWYRDLDGDGFGDASASVDSCEPVDGFVENGDDCDDACVACHPGASEICDAEDNDCDGSVDQTFACSPGEAVACVTGCGTAGMGACTSACAAPSGDACSPPAEICNGADEDCDGMIDETFTCAPGTTSVCTTACGTVGTGACTSACEPAPSSACMPPAESCNGMDDDCDGSPDQSFACVLGSTVACTTSCGTTGSGACTGACAIPSGVACAPPAEICNGLDDDCDGMPDDGFDCVAGRSASCTTACGSTGTGTCSASCTRAPATSCTPPAETCSHADDDCDGLVDEDVMRGGTPVVVGGAYYYRPRVARGLSRKLYAIYTLGGRQYLSRLNDDGTVDRSPFEIGASTEYDLASNVSGRVIYARVVPGGVSVHQLEDTPIAGAPYRWTRMIDTDAIEVSVAVGSRDLWVYTRNAAGRVELHTLSLTSGEVLGGPTYVATSPTRIAVTSNGYRDHIVAVHVTDWVFWFQYDADYGRERSGVFAVDPTRLRGLAIAGDYRYAPIARSGLLIAYSLAAGGGQPAELRYYSWRDGGATTDQRITTGTTPSSDYPQLDLEMRDGIAQLGAVWTSSSTSYTGSPRVYQLSRDASGAGYSAHAISFSLPSEEHQGISVIRFADADGAVDDRLFYDPPGGGIASVPIGCP